MRLWLKYKRAPLEKLSKNRQEWNYEVNAAEVEVFDSDHEETTRFEETTFKSVD